MLEYLEDIIGSNCFIEDIEKKEQELEVINDQRQEQLNRVKVYWIEESDWIVGSKRAGWIRRRQDWSGKVYQYWERSADQQGLFAQEAVICWEWTIKDDWREERSIRKEIWRFGCILINVEVQGNRRGLKRTNRC